MAKMEGAEKHHGWGGGVPWLERRRRRRQTGIEIDGLGTWGVGDEDTARQHSGLCLPHRETEKKGLCLPHRETEKKSNLTGRPYILEEIFSDMFSIFPNNSKVGIELSHHYSFGDWN
jgi:hypothetical protein